MMNTQSDQAGRTTELPPTTKNDETAGDVGLARGSIESLAINPCTAGQRLEADTYEIATANAANAA